MKLTKEQVYINLKGKTKEELTDLWEFLTSNGEKPLRWFEYFLDYEHANGVSQNIGLDYQGKWSNDILVTNKAEVKRLQYLMEEEDKPKVGILYIIIILHQFIRKCLITLIKEKEK